MPKDTDINYHSVADTDGFEIRGIIFDPALGSMKPVGTYDDTLKFSRATNGIITDITVHGGTENAIDCNRFCRNLAFSNVHLQGGDQAAIVVKGECQNISFTNITITPSRKAYCEILWDDYSDQSRSPSSGLFNTIGRSDGKPVRLIFGRFKRPHITNSNIKIRWFLTIGLHILNAWKDIWR